MKIDIPLFVHDLTEAPAAARNAEALGFDGVWTQDTQHNPMFPLVLAAEHTEELELGTAILVAFARSPMDVAYQAWDLAKMSRGRFILGLGTQVKPHIERRFSMPWDAPVAKLREYVHVLRAIWHSWQTGERLNFRGDFFKVTLMTPFFDPGPIDHPDIPIYIAGVNERLCRLTGELADGFHLHPYHSVRYVKECVFPWIEAGARANGRSLDDVSITTTVFVVTGRDEAELEAAKPAVRQQIAFYASTPTYQTVMEVHGWQDTAQALQRLAARKQWAEMGPLITDEMLDTFAVIAPHDELASAVQARYDGILDRVTYYTEFLPEGLDDDFWRMTVDAFHRA